MAGINIVPGSITIVTADAGVGKSSYLLGRYPAGSTIFLAPTGVAAARLGTRTLHSLLRLGVDKPRPAAASAASISDDDVAHIVTATTVVIDEAYYCPADVAEAADAVLREICRGDRVAADTPPFGGKDIVLAGDPWQLQLGTSTAIDYVAGFGVADRVVIPHHPAMRCAAHYLNAVKMLQSPTICIETIREFAARGRPAPIHDAPWLVFTNASRDAINGAAPVVGDPIMLLRNTNISAGFFNGTRGILAMRGGRPHIAITNAHGTSNKYCPLQSDDYEKCRAMTIHKSQGTTLAFANIYLDLDRMHSDVNRLLYVALTRVHDYNCYHLCFSLH